MPGFTCPMCGAIYNYVFSGGWIMCYSCGEEYFVDATSGEVTEV